MSIVRNIRRPFLTANWRDLIVANFKIDPMVLQRFVPRGVELDFFNGDCFVSLVGFRFENTRWLGTLPIIPYQNFSEVNLRFYVKRKVASELRRGVCFIKEIVPYAFIAFVARTLYNEPYIALPMQQDSQHERHLGYQWQSKSGANFIETTKVGELHDLHEKTLESFILEHYWGYTKQKDGSTKEYQVWHPGWRFWHVGDFKCHLQIEELYGVEFVEVLKQRPHSVFIAQGSEVGVYSGVRCA